MKKKNRETKNIAIYKNMETESTKVRDDIQSLSDQIHNELTDNTGSLENESVNNAETNTFQTSVSPSERTEINFEVESEMKSDSQSILETSDITNSGLDSVSSHEFNSNEPILKEKLDESNGNNTLIELNSTDTLNESEITDDLNTAKINQKPEKISQFPLTRIKDIMKSDPDISVVNTECVFLISKATEMFLQKLGREMHTVTLRNKKKTLQKKDLDSAISENPAFEFLEGALN